MLKNPREIGVAKFDCAHEIHDVVTVLPLLFSSMMERDTEYSMLGEEEAHSTPTGTACDTVDRGFCVSRMWTLGLGRWWRDLGGQSSVRLVEEALESCSSQHKRRSGILGVGGGLRTNESNELGEIPMQVGIAAHE